MNNPIQTKFCPRCKQEKLLTEWYTRRQQEPSSYCKLCVNEHSTQRMYKTKEKIVEFLGGSCNRCGYNKCHAALHLHHLDPAEKDPSFTGIKFWKWERVQKEIEKCELLCANCHAEEHYSIH